MAVLKIGNVQPKQREVMRLKNRHIAYGGARGGGKSWMLRAKLKLFSLKYDGFKSLLLRKTYPELYENHLKFLIPELHGFAKYNDKNKEFRFPNGSILTLGYCANDNDVQRYQGSEYDAIGIDEAQQFKWDWIERINQSVRGVNDYPKRTYYTLNPGGISHADFKKRFIDRRFEDNENPDDYAFIQALVTDNYVLMEAQPEYIKSLEAIQSEKLRRAWRYGDWDIFDGQFFDEFRDNPNGYKTRQWTHVIEPFEVPDSWTIYRSFDWGFTRPFSVGWWAVDHDGTLYRILEMYGWTGEPDTGVKWTSAQIFSEIARAENEHRWLKGKRVSGVADPSIWAGTNTGITIEDDAAAHGVYFAKADNTRVPGWMQVRYRLQFDEDGFPKMYFFKNCKAAIRTMPMMLYDERKPDDLDETLEDHAVDEIRYMCMLRPIKPRLTKEEPIVLFDPLNQYKTS